LLWRSSKLEHCSNFEHCQFLKRGQAQIFLSSVNNFEFIFCRFLPV
jgi:hypothetical protein